MSGWCPVAEQHVIRVLPNLGVGRHTPADSFCGVWHRLGSFGSITLWVLMFNTLRWVFRSGCCGYKVVKVFNSILTYTWSYAVITELRLRKQTCLCGSRYLDTDQCGRVVSVSQSQSYFTTDSQSVSKSLCRAQSGTWPEIYIFLKVTVLSYLGRPLWREVGSVICHCECRSVNKCFIVKSYPSV
jgi:hypothetical protein